MESLQTLPLFKTTKNGRASNSGRINVGIIMYTWQVRNSFTNYKEDYYALGINLNFIGFIYVMTVDIICKAFCKKN